MKVLIGRNCLNNMSVLIGHASIDENKKTSGGVAGDQTGKEVCTRNWYSNNWTYVLRCKDSKIAEKMVTACEKACKNNNIGYDQNQRNTLRSHAYASNFDISMIKAPCECDCSSLMAVCAECAGVKIPYNGSNAPTTRTMKKAFTSTGLFDVLTDIKYLNSDKYLKKGDILVKEGHHTVMVLGNGANYSSNANESTKTANKSQKTSYKVGESYTLNSNLYIREQPFGEKMKFSCITEDAQKHSKFDNYGNAILNAGTRVTCKAISMQTDSTWMLIPSGWVCAAESGKVYIS